MLPNILGGVYILISLPLTFSQNNLMDCPLEWKLFEEHCYNYVIYPEKSYEDAMQSCVNVGATLVSVNTRREHDAILAEMSTQKSLISRSWYTSGSAAVWEGDGTSIPPPSNNQNLNDVSKWIIYDDWLYQNEATVTNYTKVITYYLDTDTQTFKFRRSNRHQERRYICEIARAEVPRMFQSPRDYSYGQSKLLPESKYQMAPRMVKNPENTIVVGSPRQIFIECIAHGNPEPTYKWYTAESLHGQFIPAEERNVINPNDRVNDGTQVTSYTLTNGRLTINNPNSNNAANYQCRVSNKYGTLLSNPVTLAFRDLGEFSNVEPSPVTVSGDKGAQIGCPRITKTTAPLRYQWAKDTEHNFVRPEQNKHIFISSNGKLYFSRVQKTDEGHYYCLVVLDSSGSTQGSRGSGRVESRISLPVPLIVGTSDGGNQKPEIQDGFIIIHPQQPKLNQNVQLECFAIGTNLEYNWLRYDVSSGRSVGVPLPKDHRIIDHNRILEISNVKIEDGGIYSCQVISSETQQTAETNRTLTIECWFLCCIFRLFQN